MKTIEEEEVFLSNKNVLSNINWNDTSELERLKAKYCDGFEAGVEFAQRWISVEDELPEITTINNHNAVNVKFKTIYGDERVCTATLESFSQHCGENSPMNDVWYVYPSGGHVLRNVTHWRPIELK